MSSACTTLTPRTTTCCSWRRPTGRAGASTASHALPRTSGDPRSLPQSSPSWWYLPLIKMRCCFVCRCGLLAAGTTAGVITVFKFTPPKEGDTVIDFAKCWEVQPSFQVREASDH